MIFMNRRPASKGPVDTIGPVFANPFASLFAHPLSLRLKINLIVAALTLLFALAVVTLQLRSLRDSVHEEVVAANRVAAQLLQRTAWRYAATGTSAMLAFLQGIGRVRSNDITLFDAQGAELYRSPPPTYKAGRDAPDWFAALIGPPPSVQAISFPDGKLEVRANASRAEVDAWDTVVALAGGALAMLLVVNALVFWLVGRALQPFGQIVQALNALQAGRFDVALPPLAGLEAAAIGAAFNRMVGELQGHIEIERRAVRAELQLSDSRELTRWIDQHVEAERRLIARELHDELGQSVTAVRSMALSIAQRVQALDPQAEAAARLIAEESLRLYDAMHGIIPRLTPLVLDNFGLADALADLVERTQRSQADVQVALEVALGAAVLPAEVSLALYRAAQEGVTNAMRHGQAHRLTLTVHGQADQVTLELIDDGVGLAADWAQKTGHHGLRWLAERAQSLGGSFEIAAAAPRGVRLHVRLPLSAGSLSGAP
jgi:two-component system, NarL family, sensor histidine kinase UhpB